MPLQLWIMTTDSSSVFVCKKGVKLLRISCCGIKSRGVAREGLGQKTKSLFIPRYCVDMHVFEQHSEFSALLCLSKVGLARLLQSTAFVVRRRASRERGWAILYMYSSAHTCTLIFTDETQRDGGMSERWQGGGLFFHPLVMLLFGYLNQLFKSSHSKTYFNQTNWYRACFKIRLFILTTLASNNNWQRVQNVKLLVSLQKCT